MPLPAAHVMQKASQLAREGRGWEDLRVQCGLTEAEARLIVFGFVKYRDWKAKQEKKAS